MMILSTGNCTWISWFEQVAWWRVAQVFFHSSAWLSMTATSVTLFSDRSSSLRIRKWSRAPVQSASQQDHSKSTWSRYIQTAI